MSKTQQFELWSGRERKTTVDIRNRQKVQLLPEIHVTNKFYEVRTYAQSFIYRSIKCVSDKIVTLSQRRILLDKNHNK
jgi:hypothetical protein